MAGKKNSRTSKTDHVLSLLSGGTPDQSQSTAAPEQPSPQAEPQQMSPGDGESSAVSKMPDKQKHSNRSRKKESQEPQSVSHTEGSADIAPPPANREGERLAPPILQVARTNNDALSETIRDALSQTLEEDLAQETQAQDAPAPMAMSQPAPEPAPEPQPTPAPAASGGKMSQDAIEELMKSMSAPKAEPEPAPEPQPAPAPAAGGGKMSQDAIEELMKSMSAPTAEPEPAPEPQPAPAAGGGKMSQDAIEELMKSMSAPKAEPEPAPEAEPVSESKPEAAPSPEGSSNSEPAPAEPEVPFSPRKTSLPDGAVCMNVMEILVDERLERYVKMFGLCSCPRCLADARALALTRLPPKYVVMADSAATPMLSLYRAKFESMVIAQVIQACKTVMENPRHSL